MKKIAITLGLCISSLFCDVVTILPYGGKIDYGSDPRSSYKDSATFYGVYASVGNLSYLLEAEYAKFRATYKDPLTPDLRQDDYAVVFSKYNRSYMYKLGAHFVDTNDLQLGDGIVGIVGVGGYNFFGYDKLSYGVDGYFSFYKDGHNEEQNVTSDVTQKIFITQLVPYIGYYKAINRNLGNKIQLKINSEFASKYKQKKYFLYEINDTVYYKKIYLALKYYDGELRTGVLDNGFSVYNTLDVMKNGYGVTLGYKQRNIHVALSYVSNTYREYDIEDVISKDNTTSSYYATLSIGF